MNREDILKVYEEGPEAVVELVQSLFAIIARLEVHLGCFAPLFWVNYFGYLNSYLF